MENDLVVLAEQLGIRLKDKRYRIATAESCTGGWIAQTLTEIPGSSAWFDRGFVTYSNLSKIQMLGIDPQVLSKCGAVSLDIAQQMLAGVFKNSEADIAIAVTGIAGPDGGSAEKPVGTVYVGRQLKNGLPVVAKLHLSGNRHQIRKETVSLSIAGALALLY
ncbi:MAG: CinA family protein [Methylococcaceae bacterium]|nr:CinA family protein [Methylococcaceae bacterium]